MKSIVVHLWNTPYGIIGIENPLTDWDMSKYFEHICPGFDHIAYLGGFKYRVYYEE